MGQLGGWHSPVALGKRMRRSLARFPYLELHQPRAMLANDAVVQVRVHGELAAQVMYLHDVRVALS